MQILPWILIILFIGFDARFDFMADTEPVLLTWKYKPEDADPIPAFFWIKIYISGSLQSPINLGQYIVSRIVVYDPSLHEYNLNIDFIRNKGPVHIEVAATTIDGTASSKVISLDYETQ